ncbi:MAG: hypothetical protein H6833_07330 [Planctomycetes bacterium]|nr:hypothetical protein [Planctomycetota bacterium]
MSRPSLALGIAVGVALIATWLALRAPTDGGNPVAFKSNESGHDPDQLDLQTSPGNERREERRDETAREPPNPDSTRRPPWVVRGRAWLGRDVPYATGAITLQLWAGYLMRGEPEETVTVHTDANGTFAWEANPPDHTAEPLEDVIPVFFRSTREAPSKNASPGKERSSRTAGSSPSTAWNLANTWSVCDRRSGPVDNESR